MLGSLGSVASGQQRDDNADQADRTRCSPCRGTGRVLSSLGGTPREVTCPWCEGSGTFKPGHDAQLTQS